MPTLPVKDHYRLLSVGGKHGEGSREYYPDPRIEIVPIDRITGWDVMERGLPDGPWDIILAHNFIEHIPRTDFFLKECARVMEPQTWLDIETPNMASWFNRISLLCGYLPHPCEVSDEINPGKVFPGELAGHLRIFTTTALLELLQYHGFIIHATMGMPWLPDGTRYFPWRVLEKFTSHFPQWTSHIRVWAKRSSF